MRDERQELLDQELIEQMDYSGRLYRAAPDLLATCEAVVNYVNYKMDRGEHPCPLCGHHYVHTTEENRQQRYERDVCPYPQLVAVIDKARGIE